MRFSIFGTALAAAIVTFISFSAQAATFHFSYGEGNKTLSAFVEGTLQADGNTVFVSAIRDISRFGIALPFALSVGSARLSVHDRTLRGQGVLSLDGSVLDFYACDQYCEAFFGILPLAEGGVIWPQFIASDAFSGDTFTPLVPQWYSLTPVAAVPLPAGGLMLASALGGVAMLRRKKKAA